MKTGVLAEPILVGREKELETLEVFLNSAAEGKGKTLLISGEAGSGKSRLAREFLSTARKKGVAVMAGWCLSDAATPYFPFVEAFNRYFGSLQEEQSLNLQKLGAQSSFVGTRRPVSGDRGITAWLTASKKAGKDRGEASSPQVWKDQVFAGIAGTLHEISVKTPAILFLEDIHWADSASLALLHYLARVVKDAERILVLATYRSEELTADAEGRPHLLAETLCMMDREDLFTEIKLSSLTSTEVHKIAENMVGGNLQLEFAARLMAESKGNPLFLVESLRMLSEQKNLVQEGEGWRLGVDEIGIPSKVKGIILRRLAILKYAQRRILDAASVIGAKFDVELLSSVLGQDSFEVLETLNLIAQSTSLVSVEEDRYRFDHDRSRETLYEALSPPLKKGYHARIAERLENTGKGGKLPFDEMAYHFAQAGNAEKALKYALEAGQDALARFSNAEAIGHFSYVLKTVPNILENACVRSIALEGLGDAYYANCLFAKALETFESLADLESGASKLRAYRKAMDAVYFGMIDFPERLLKLAGKAEPFVASDRLESARVLFLKSSSSRERVRGYEEALKVFEEEYSIPDVAKALVPVGVLRLIRQEYGRGVSATLRSIAMFEEMNDLRGLLEATFYAGKSLLFCGALSQEALDMFSKAVQIGEKTGNYSIITQARLLMGLMAERQGRLEEALSQSLKALEYRALTDRCLLEQEIYPNLARQYAKLGDLNHAEEYLAKIESLPPELRDSSVLNRGVAVRNRLRAQAVLLAARNNWKQAEEYFQKHFELSRTETVSAQISVRRDYAWALARQGRTDEANILLQEVNKITEEVEKNFAHVSVQVSLMAKREIVTGEELEVRLDLVNVSTKTGSLVKIEELVPREFEVVDPPAKYAVENGFVDMKGKIIGPLKIETIKLSLRALKSGSFKLNPRVTYIDESGETRTCITDAVTITAEPAKPKFEILPDRITTGFEELDALLLGGIPEKHAVVLAAPANDERELLVTRYLEAGAEAGEITFHLTTEAGNAKVLAEKHPTNFHIVLCNPQADTIIQNLPNVYKLKGVENLTEIDIALTKAFRTLNNSAAGTRRICIDLVSDVLLQHHTVTARKWLSSLLPTLKGKSFTTLAVVDPQMHPAEEIQAILALFNGEMRVSERETARGTEKVLRIRKLSGQKYVENEIVLNKEKLAQNF